MCPFSHSLYIIHVSTKTISFVNPSFLQYFHLFVDDFKNAGTWMGIGKSLTYPEAINLRRMRRRVTVVVPCVCACVLLNLLILQTRGSLLCNCVQSVYYYILLYPHPFSFPNIADVCKSLIYVIPIQ